MTGYLIAEEGPLSGRILVFDHGNEWVIGRDPDEAQILLEDSMVSRKHLICRATPEGYQLENLSSVNPITQNGRVVTDSVLLREDDIIQIGSTFFRFTEKDPKMHAHVEEPLYSKEVVRDQPSRDQLNFEMREPTRLLIKVIGGPNTGAEFSLENGKTYLVGKDPNLCDITFQDLSVSRQHARLVVEESGDISIEDLSSRNGVLVNGELISGRAPVLSQDLISLGTTTFLVIDREEMRETIFSPMLQHPKIEPVVAHEPQEALQFSGQKKSRDWKKNRFSKKALILGASFGASLFFLLMVLFSLLGSKPIVISIKKETEEIHHVLHKYPAVNFTFNASSGKLFLVGFVRTPVEQQELLYLLKGIPSVKTIENNVVVDELVWQNLNALLGSNPEWKGVSVYSMTPGKYILRGYLTDLDQAQALSDYINSNFPYLDRVENQVVVESDLLTQVQSLLLSHGFSGVSFQFSNGELLLTGMIDEKRHSEFQSLNEKLQHLHGVRLVKNFVIESQMDLARIDLSAKYQVVGYSKRDEKNFYVVINGKILSQGDTLDGMVVTNVLPKVVQLEKDGVKYKITYNPQ